MLRRAGSGGLGPSYSWPGSHSSPPPTRDRQTDTETGRHNERSQLSSAVRQTTADKSDKSFLGQTFLACRSIPSALFQAARTHQSVTITSNNAWWITFFYLFFKTPGFDDLRCQSETWRVFNTLVHLTETPPDWWEREGEKKTGIIPVNSHKTSWKHAWECRTWRFMFQWPIKKWSSFQLRRFTVLCVLKAVFH